MAENNVVTFLPVLPNGELVGSAAGLLGAAGRIGTPVAVIVAPPGQGQAAAAAAGQFGAQLVYLAETSQTQSVLTAPALETVAAAVGATGAEAVLLPNDVDGRDIAARLAVRLQAAVAADAVGIDRDAEGIVVHHSVYGSAYTTESAPTHGTLIVTLREGAVDDRAEAAQPAVEAVEVETSGAAAAQITGFSENLQASTRPDLRSAATVVSGGRGLGSARASPWLSSSPMSWGPVWAPPGPPWMPATRRIPIRWARPGSPSLRISTSPWASPGQCSTKQVCSRRRRSWPSIRTPRRPSSTSPTSASSAMPSMWSRS